MWSRVWLIAAAVLVAGVACKCPGGNGPTPTPPPGSVTQGLDPDDPSFIDPCPTCTLHLGTGQLDGKINPSYTGAPWPWKDMTVVLRRANGVVIQTLGPSDLDPDSGSAGDLINQTVTLATGANTAASAEISWIANDNTPVKGTLKLLRD